ncbi:ATP-binding protein [Alloalcanivorax xenomutans]|uniref:ATP-binding protein n=1 Tax=Alloalcanivorax xenomutans TaxID=1094342 RepID=UPI003BAC880A
MTTPHDQAGLPWPPSGQRWTPVRIYNVYRIAIASVLLILHYTHQQPSLGQHLPLLFEFTMMAYLALIVISTVLEYSERLPRPNWAQSFALIVDVIALGLVVHANGGLEGGLAVLLLITVAAGNILLRGRMGFLIAALATLTVMYEQFYFATQSGERDPFSLTESGLLGIAFFMVSVIIQQIASRLERSETIAADQQVALDRLEALNEQIVRRMRTGILVFDRHGRILQSNPSADNAFAMAMSGQPLPEPLRQRHQAWRQAPHILPPPLRASKQSPELSARFAPLDTSHEQLTLVFLEDTARIAQEAQQLNLASLGRLSATLAHEIRNPLSAINHATELLREDAGDDSDRRLLDMVRTHVQRVDGIISDVLDLSRRPRGQAQRLVLKDVLAEIAATCHENRKTRLQMDLATDTELRFDRGQLIQILDNLIGNAFRHGGEQVRVRVTHGVHSKTRLPWIAVSDDGPGIGEEQARHLFEPFFTTHAKGNGLGLFVCQQLCQANQASLSHEPADRGACFMITCAHPDRQFQ